MALTQGVGYRCALRSSLKARTLPRSTPTPGSSEVGGAAASLMEAALLGALLGAPRGAMLWSCS